MSKRRIQLLGILLWLAAAALVRAQPPRAAASNDFILRAPAARIQDVAARHGLTVIQQIDGQDLFQMIAWDKDLTFVQTQRPLPLPADNVLARRLLAMPEYRSFWATVSELDVPFYLHPRAQLPSRSQYYEGHPWLMSSPWGFAVETSIHALRLCGSGLFDDFPNLTPRGNP